MVNKECFLYSISWRTSLGRTKIIAMKNMEKTLIKGNNLCMMLGLFEGANGKTSIIYNANWPLSRSLAARYSLFPITFFAMWSLHMTQLPAFRSMALTVVSSSSSDGTIMRWFKVVVNGNASVILGPPLAFINFQPRPISNLDPFHVATGPTKTNRDCRIGTLPDSAECIISH